jgi:hypothetical protein
VDFFNHNAGTGIIVLFVEITSDALLKVFGLADIQEFLLFIVELINPWCIRQSCNLESLLNFGHAPKIHQLRVRKQRYYFSYLALKWIK